jgi:hypothetical protein
MRGEARRHTLQGIGGAVARKADAGVLPKIERFDADLVLPEPPDQNLVERGKLVARRHPSNQRDVSRDSSAPPVYRREVSASSVERRTVGPTAKASWPERRERRRWAATRRVSTDGNRVSGTLPKPRLSDPNLSRVAHRRKRIARISIHKPTPANNTTAASPTSTAGHGFRSAGKTIVGSEVGWSGNQAFRLTWMATGCPPMWMGSSRASYCICVTSSG